ncbi:tigger transposable element-derived protein 6-like [Parasteatoda tepidariorum]|uniref:tigger transposable element-derived protein 6-like n=1 Tax=Parasteatoda tepidariorum TaxID=114398 RepID=UPI0039BD08E9
MSVGGPVIRQPLTRCSQLVRDQENVLARATHSPDLRAKTSIKLRYMLVGISPSYTRERYGIVAKQICGEANSVDLKAVNDWKSEKISDAIRSYDPSDVFNADEAGIFSQLLPNKTLAFKKDKCIGGKNSKLRLTALFCCNMSGTEKRKVTVIGKSAKPRCL